MPGTANVVRIAVTVDRSTADFIFVSILGLNVRVGVVHFATHATAIAEEDRTALAARCYVVTEQVLLLVAIVAFYSVLLRKTAAPDLRQDVRFEPDENLALYLGARRLSAKRSGAAMYPAIECGRLAVGPDVIR
jgi:hypothetical protein